MRAWLDPLQKAIKNDENKAIDIQEKMQAKDPDRENIGRSKAAK